VGQEVNASLLDTAITLQSWEAAAYPNLGIVSQRAGTGHDLSNHHLSSVYQVFRTADGHIVVATVQEARWRDFCRMLDRPELAGDPRFDSGPKRVACHAELTEVLQAALLTRGSGEWLARLHEIDIACGPVYSQPETFADPQVLHNQMVVDWSDERGQVRYLGLPVKLSRTPGAIRSTAPDRGEHTDAILAELGYDGPSISELRRKGVV
jgi:crotonobetainyl-CoA:carnitine CoA-transferase CaiB-like acyl-CoA transferase